ncbi:fungal-specific transcription factor domain-containing protein [Xylaria sp. FL1042]|nr:fungal-specific transcription factor domain-containing protein [Xylaria sp. FL1042]
MADFTTKVADELEIDISNQENVSQRTNTIRRNSKQHVRHRASIACYSCRDRRIRCVVPKGASECTQCKRSGTECIIKMDDERRRPISKAYVSSLSARIELLESMLEETGVLVPPATHPPATKHEAQSAGSGDEVRISALEARRRSKSDAHSTHRHVPSPPYSHEDFAMSDNHMEDSVGIDTLQLRNEPFQKEFSSSERLDLKQEDVMDQLLFPRKDHTYDTYNQLSRKLPLSGPSTDCPIYAESLNRYEVGESLGQIRRAERVIRSLTPKTHDYLMQNFWKHQNSVLQVVDRAAFEADKGSETPKFYSSFLHIIMLALGWRYADKDCCDIARINLGNYESVIHREAKSMLETDLERPMGISSVQSLLLLGDLEYGVGRENISWMYHGMANRLAFDLCLDVDSSNIGLSDQEIRVRRRVMKACIIYDNHWALFYGRGASIKSRDIHLDLSKAFVSTTRPYGYNPCIPTDTVTIEEEIHDQLFELMNLAGRIAESRAVVGHNRSVNRAASFAIREAEENTSPDVLILDQQLRDWYQRLPSHLTWGPNNIRTAPFSYFFLHGHYHAILILLHRSREVQGLACEDERASLSPSSPHSQTDSSIRSAPSKCTKSAIQFAQIVSQSKENCEFGKVCCTILQPARIASFTLLSAIAQSKDDEDRRICLSSLRVLSDFIRGMSISYQPAARLENAIQAGLARLHFGMRNHSGQDALRFKGDEKARCTNANMFSSLQTDQDYYVGNQFASNNERPYTIGTQAGSESAKPRLASHTPPGPACSQYPHGDHLNIMPGLVPTFPYSPDRFLNLDSLYTMGANDMHTNFGISPIRYGSDNYLRVAPSAKGWGLQSLHAASQLEKPDPDLDSRMPDWVGESVTALSVPKFDGQSAELSSGPDSNLDTKTLSMECKREGPSSERGTSALTPMSPNNSTQSSDKSDLNHVNSDDAAPRRNYELDYLSL